jgi:DNA sulfur modification protein DndB
MNSLTLLALRGVQAEREYFVTVCPLKYLPRLFLFDEKELPAEVRAQRVLNAARVPEIARYLTENQSTYVLSAITASIDADVSFEPLTESLTGGTVGKLVVPLTARLLINDGQHRRAAVERALEERPELGEETIGVIFFLDAGLERSQQMFADLNRHAVRPTRSLGILYDHRDPLAALARQIAATVDPFKGRTEMEKTSLSHRSTKLFTLSAIYQALRALLRQGAKEAVTPEALDVAVEYWAEVGTLIRSWGFVGPNVSSADLRRDYLHTHAVALHALGVAGASLVTACPDDWKERLARLRTVDWSRSNTALWEGRALRNGRVSKAGPSVTLTATVLKGKLELPLSPEEEQLEADFARGEQRDAA